MQQPGSNPTMGKAATIQAQPSNEPFALIANGKRTKLRCAPFFFQAYELFYSWSNTPVPRLTILCIIHGNLAKCCSATHLTWIILFDRQVKDFSFLILLLAGRAGVRALHWEASQRGCLIVASVEIDPGRWRLGKKEKAMNLRERRSVKCRETGTWWSGHVNSSRLTLWMPVGVMHFPSHHWWKAQQSSSMFPAQHTRETGWKTVEQLVLLSPRWKSHRLNVSDNMLSVKAEMQTSFWDKGHCDEIANCE